MALLKINSVDIKTPSEMQVGVFDIDAEGGTTRNANGELIRDRVAVKRKLTCKFPPMTQSQISTLLNSMTATFFSVTYLDPQDGVVTKTMYAGDRSTPLYKYGNGTTDVLWENMNVEFIEK